MFNITDTTRFNGAIFSLGNTELPPTGENIDIRSSSSNHLVSINGIVPTGDPDTDSITGITIKGGLTSMGVIGSITKAIDLPFGPSMAVGVSGTIDHIPLNPLASTASVTVATIGSLNVLDTTAFPISQVGFSEYFLDNTPYTFTQAAVGVSSGTVTFSIPVAGGPINSMTITNPGVGYVSIGTGTVETSASGTKKELSFAINEVYATISIVSGGTLYDTNLASPGYIIAFVGGAYGVIPTGDYSLALDYCGEGYSVGKYAIVRGTSNTALMEVLSVDSVGAVRSYLLDSTAIGKDYSVGEATIQDLATPLLNPATFIIDSVSGSGGGSYTDAEAITALTNSTSPYIVGQTMNANLSVATGLTVLAGGANITGQLDATEAMIDGDLAVTTGNLYVDAGDLSISVGDLQLATGNVLGIPLTTVIADEQFTATWVSNGDGTYTLKRHTISTQTTDATTTATTPHYNAVYTLDGTGRYNLRREATLNHNIFLTQGFLGGSASVNVTDPAVGVSPVARPAYNNGDLLHASSEYGFFSASPLQYQVLNYDGIYKIDFTGQLYKKAGSVAAGAYSLTWLDFLYYFGDSTAAVGLINTISTGANQRPYGPKQLLGGGHFGPATRYLTSGSIYNGINMESLNLTSTSTPPSPLDLGFARFSEALHIDDRVILDSCFYWASGV